ncbi:GNAT family N-acetyltransferase [Fumia xinanensis]|uniref:GNAT family N-acetyltransferase n=1 Tax=Fumia xinanensis TaxID=2763659 RepID=A0A926I6I8_9FIRM|nr:GNAT family N-acetyltransferase [Fumia xinanensis]MBC8558842.1 GNAT family N-acetyltransferase [Fumia xinanensis]
MVELNKEQIPRISPLYEGIQETLIWGCLDGSMGRAFADNAEHPKAAQIVSGDFCFLAGDSLAPGAKELILNFHACGDCMFIVPYGENWASQIEKVYGARAQRITRYAIHKDGDVFDREHLKRLSKSLPQGFCMTPIGEKEYEMILQEKWCRDFCGNFLSSKDYVNRGLGFVAWHDGKIVAGASSYTVYQGGIEIEIVTHENYRQRGLASACGAALILACLQKGLYPSWDAANLKSVGLAKKLGYHYDREYLAYCVSRDAAAHSKKSLES